MMNPVIVLKGVGKRYRRLWVFRDIDFVWHGGGLLVIGPNGQGKSTLLRILAGLTRPSRGKVLVFGKDPWQEEGRGRVGFVGHESGLYPGLSGRENLEIFRRMVEGRREVLMERAEALGITDFWDRPVREYSAGMKKKVSLVRAFLHEPDLLLLDEPFASLDPPSRNILQMWLVQLLDRGVHVMVVSHTHEDLSSRMASVRLTAKALIPI